MASRVPLLDHLLGFNDFVLLSLAACAVCVSLHPRVHVLFMLPCGRGWLDGSWLFQYHCWRGWARSGAHYISSSWNRDFLFWTNILKTFVFPFPLENLFFPFHSLRVKTLLSVTPPRLIWPVFFPISQPKTQLKEVLTNHCKGSYFLSKYSPWAKSFMWAAVFWQPMGSWWQTHLMSLLSQKTLFQQEISGPTSACYSSQISPCGYLSSHYMEPVLKADSFSFFIMGEFVSAENSVFTRLPAGQYNKRFILNSISLKFHHRRQGFLLCLFLLLFSPSVAMKVSALGLFFFFSCRT